MDGLAAPYLWLAYEATSPAYLNTRPVPWRPTAAVLALGLSFGLKGATWDTAAYVSTPEGYALNVRWGPSTSYGVARKAARGTQLRLSGRYSQGWSELIDGTWVAANLINTTAVGNSQPSESWTSPASVVYVNVPEGYALNVRRGPGSSYDIAARLLRGSQIQLSSQFSGTWAQLIDSTWVDINYLQTAPVFVSSLPPTYDAAVAELQGRLKQLNYLPTNYPVSGIYDSATEQAVRDFQRVNGLMVDGIVGSSTQQALYSTTQPPQPATHHYPNAKPYADSHHQSNSHPCRSLDAAASING